MKISKQKENFKMKRYLVTALLFAAVVAFTGCAGPSDASSAAATSAVGSGSASSSSSVDADRDAEAESDAESDAKTSAAGNADGVDAGERENTENAESDSTDAGEGAAGAYSRSVDLPESTVDYSNRENWMYYGDIVGAPEGDDVAKNAADPVADVFFIAPTSTAEGANADITDSDTRASILNSTNMEIGIYNENARVYAPYYRMVTMEHYVNGGTADGEDMLTAYADVKAAFEQYLKESEGSRPIILAGFSQGSDMLYRLMIDEFGSEEMREKLVAAYAIGWPCTEEMTKKYPQLRMAQGENDTGVIISFECEAPEVTESPFFPADIRMLSINPLNWTTTGETASKEQNKGFVYVKGATYSVAAEIPNLCGAYIDETRGTLKVTDIDKADYPPRIANLPEGAYHIYDYEFFYRNLQENVAKRLQAFLAK